MLENSKFREVSEKKHFDQTTVPYCRALAANGSSQPRYSRKILAYDTVRWPHHIPPHTKRPETKQKRWGEPNPFRSQFIQKRPSRGLGAIAQSTRCMRSVILRSKGYSCARHRVHATGHRYRVFSRGGFALSVCASLSAFLSQHIAPSLSLYLPTYVVVSLYISTSLPLPPCLFSLSSCISTFNVSLSNGSVTHTSKHVQDALTWNLPFRKMGAFAIGWKCTFTARYERPRQKRGGEGGGGWGFQRRYCLEHPTTPLRNNSARRNRRS